MQSCRPWLPGAAIERGAASVPVGEAVSGWSAKWFAGPPLRVPGAPLATAGCDAGDAGGWELSEGLTLINRTATSRIVRDLMFGAVDPEVELTPADNEALEAAAEVCLADLRSRVAGAFGLPADAPWRALTSPPGQTGRRWCWSVALRPDSAPLRIAADEALIARRVRATMPPPAKAPAQATLAAALAGQSVAISARVGSCRLTTAELAELGAGDLVVLDRGLAEAAALAVDRQPKARPCTVAERDGTLTLTLVES